jgi:hypothetical protein
MACRETPVLVHSFWNFKQKKKELLEFQTKKDRIFLHFWTLSD